MISSLDAEYVLNKNLTPFQDKSPGEIMAVRDKSPHNKNSLQETNIQQHCKRRKKLLLQF